MIIGIWGDSIGYGASDTERGGWVAQLQKFAWVHNNECDVYNLSVSGANSKHVKERFEVESVARKPNLVIFAVGVNDSQYLCKTHEARVSEKETKSNLIWLHDKAKEIADNVVFVGITRVDDTKVQPIPWATEKCYSDELSEKYNKIVEEVAKEKGAHFISMRDIVAPEEMSDGLHPGPEGHQKMFKEISEYLLTQKLLD